MVRRSPGHAARAFLSLSLRHTELPRHAALSAAPSRLSLLPLHRAHSRAPLLASLAGADGVGMIVPTNAHVGRLADQYWVYSWDTTKVRVRAFPARAASLTRVASLPPSASLAA